MKRRQWLATLGATACVPGAWAENGKTLAACAQPLSAALAQHEWVRAAWQGLDPARVWDVHAHVVGVGNGGTGTYVHPDSQSWFVPVERLRRIFIMRAACVSDIDDAQVDATYIQRLHSYVDAMPEGYRAMLFAFDYAVDGHGDELHDHSTFAVPNDYVARVVARHPKRFEWVASIHPYRADALDRLAQAVERGARAVKWVPSAMNIDPASARCDAFYKALVQGRTPLIVHCGEERAVPGARKEAYNNPLRLRHALGVGVRIVAAHCASNGYAVDMDRGPNGPEVEAFDLFARLMDEPRNQSRLYGDISAVFQRNRDIRVQRTLLNRTDWHARLLHGSDYPLPGVSFLYNLDALADAGMLPQDAVPVLEALQTRNPLLFEFVLKRTLRDGQARFAPSVFHTRDFFDLRS